jgi:hypothetical protein
MLRINSVRNLSLGHFQSSAFETYEKPKHVMSWKFLRNADGPRNNLRRFIDRNIQARFFELCFLVGGAKNTSAPGSTLIVIACDLTGKGLFASGQRMSSM